MSAADLAPTLDDLRLASARRLARTRPRGAGRWWAVGILATAVGAMFLPWQQNVQGKGELTALSPSDRAQVVPAVVGGAITEWRVREGAYVRRGDPLARIGEVKDEYLDPNTLDRYREQLSAKRSAVDAKRAKVEALGTQIAALERGQRVSIEQAENAIQLYDAAVAAAVADSAVAFDQLQRRERLAADGLSSTNDLQAARLRHQQAVARTVEKRNELANARLKLRALDAEYAEKLAKARADRGATLAEVSEGTADASKLLNAVDNLARRTSYYEIRAPQDGYVVQALRAGVGEQVKPGDAIVTIQPARAEMAAAIRVRAVDVPLLSAGRAVRLQFDGWPALQFSGWPRAAVGTFGGRIAVVDRVARPDGTFRVLVTPDPRDEPWPPQLRQGSGVLAWAMLDEVRLGYELWRRVNGFPQSLDKVPDAGAGTGKGGK